MEKIKVALVGFGGIARTHNTAYHQLIKEGMPIELVAVCDKNAERLTEKLDFNLGNDDTPLPEGIRFYTEIDELIDKEDFDLADICLPTFLHKDITVKMLRAGKHVLCEKPMALSSADCEEMLRARDESGKRLMIAHILRFTAPYLYLKDCVDSGRYGKLRELQMNRYSVYPTWGVGSYFNDISKCGGATLDTHIHDIDIAHMLLGMPDSVSAVEHINIPHIQSVNSRLYYPETTVIANCAWDATFEEPFRADYRARFDNATAVYADDIVTVYPYDAEKFTVQLDTQLDYAAELRLIAELILDEKMENLRCPPESTCVGVKLIEAIRRSAASGGERIVLI